MKRKIKLIVSTIVFGAFIVAALACQSSSSIYEKAYQDALSNSEHENNNLK